MNKKSTSLVGVIIAPFLSAMKALYDYENKNFVFIISLFTCCYGYSMVASPGSDLSRYLISLENVDASVIYDKSDYYVSIVQYMFSRFTKDGHLMMAFFGLIYGYVFAKSVLLLTTDVHNKRVVPYILIFGSFFSLATLGGIRQCTAFYIFFIGVYSCILKHDYKYTFLVILSALVHFAYIPYVTIFIISILLKERFLISVVIFILSFIVSVSGFSAVVSPYLSYFSGSIEDKTIGYLNADMNEFHAEYQSTLASQAVPIFYSVIIIVFLYITYVYYFDQKRSNETGNTTWILVFNLLFNSLYNITSDVAHFGLRTQITACSLIMMPIVSYLFRDITTMRKKAIYYIVIVMGFIVFWYEIRKIVEGTPWSIVLPLPICAISDTTILEILQLLGIK